jgi:hypothetical protein
MRKELAAADGLYRAVYIMLDQVAYEPFDVTCSLLSFAACIKLESWRDAQRTAAETF